jgi:hypothetical protein
MSTPAIAIAMRGLVAAARTPQTAVIAATVALVVADHGANAS